MRRLPHCALQRDCKNLKACCLASKTLQLITDIHYRQRLIEAQHHISSCFSCQECSNLTLMLEYEHREDKTCSRAIRVHPTLLARTTSEENAQKTLFCPEKRLCKLIKFCPMQPTGQILYWQKEENPESNASESRMEELPSMYLFGLVLKSW